MTKREEFLPAVHPLLLRYNQLLEAAELVIRYRCSNCTNPRESHCESCVYNPLRLCVKSAADRGADGRG